MDELKNMYYLCIKDHLRDLKELNNFKIVNHLIWINAKIERFEKEIKEIELGAKDGN